MNISKLTGSLIFALMLGLPIGIVHAAIVPLAIQTPLYPGNALTTSDKSTGLSDLILIRSYADKAQIQAQLDAGINQSGAGFTVLDAQSVYGPGTVPIPNQGAIILGTRMDFIGNNVSVPKIVFPPVLGQPAGYANVFVTLAFGQACNCVAVVELVTYSNYPNSISETFEMPFSTPVHIAFKKFKIGIEDDITKGTKTYDIDSKGVDGFSFHYKVKAPSAVAAVTVEDPFLDARNDPNSALLLFEGTSRTITFVPGPDDLEMSVKKFPMPYGGFVKLNGILNVSIVRDQALRTSKVGP